ncbi:TetR family transcriptional regulator [Paenibacillus sp. LC-T2]|uniref:TetR family transcriptional regulator n=2 Tax=Paenibacillus monticola TaxID=2666075 RepID=A0A7X2H8G5_9BACL|nr:TetR family transcriptional regulator [Paenibacillus monticola]
MSQVTQMKKKTSRDIQAAERKQQILDVAKRLFAENGYHATSMRELNKGLGMGEALTYHHFPGGKLEILNAVLQAAQEKRIKSIMGSMEFLGEDMPLRKSLLTFAHRLTEQFMDDKEYFQILFREKNLLNNEQLSLINELTLQPLEAMANFLADRAALGEVRAMDFPIAVSQFTSQIAVIIFRKMFFDVDTDSQWLERIVDHYVSLWSG